MATRCCWPPEIGRKRLRLVEYADAFQQFGSFFLGLFFRPLANFHGGQGDVLQDRHVRVEFKSLKYHADIFPQFIEIGFGVTERDAVDDDFSFLIGLQAIDAAQQGAFTGTARSANHHGLAAFDGLVNIGQHLKVAKPFADIFDFNHSKPVFLPFSSKCLEIFDPIKQKMKNTTATKL
jgi:hypothetical protein